MATNAEIQAAIATAEELAVTPEQMLSLIDRAIAEVLATGVPTISFSIAGRSVSKMSLKDLQDLRREWEDRTDEHGGGLIVRRSEWQGRRLIW